VLEYLSECEGRFEEPWSCIYEFRFIKYNIYNRRNSVKGMKFKNGKDMGSRVLGEYGEHRNILHKERGRNLFQKH